jgi:hypothetical protein
MKSILLLVVLFPVLVFSQAKKDSIFVKGEDYKFYLHSSDGLNVSYEFIKVFDSTYSENSIFESIRSVLKQEVSQMATNAIVYQPTILDDKENKHLIIKLIYTTVKKDGDPKNIISGLTFTTAADIRVKGNKAKFIFKDLDLFDRDFYAGTGAYSNNVGTDFRISLNGFITGSMILYGIKDKTVVNNVYESKNYIASRIYSVDYKMKNIINYLFALANKNLSESNF